MSRLYITMMGDQRRLTRACLCCREDGAALGGRRRQRVCGGVAAAARCDGGRAGRPRADAAAAGGARGQLCRRPAAAVGWRQSPRHRPHGPAGARRRRRAAALRHRQAARRAHGRGGGVRRGRVRPPHSGRGEAEAAAAHEDGGGGGGRSRGQGASAEPAAQEEEGRGGAGAGGRDAALVRERVQRAAADATRDDGVQRRDGRVRPAERLPGGWHGVGGGRGGDIWRRGGGVRRRPGGLPGESVELRHEPAGVQRACPGWLPRQSGGEPAGVRRRPGDRAGTAQPARFVLLERTQSEHEWHDRQSSRRRRPLPAVADSHAGAAAGAGLALPGGWCRLRAGAGGGGAADDAPPPPLPHPPVAARRPHGHDAPAPAPTPHGRRPRPLPDAIPRLARPVVELVATLRPLVRRHLEPADHAGGARDHAHRPLAHRGTAGTAVCRRTAAGRRRRRAPTELREARGHLPVKGSSPRNSTPVGNRHTSTVRFTAKPSAALQN